MMIEKYGALRVFSPLALICIFVGLLSPKESYYFFLVCLLCFSSAYAAVAGITPKEIERTIIDDFFHLFSESTAAAIVSGLVCFGLFWVGRLLLGVALNSFPVFSMRIGLGQ